MCDGIGLSAVVADEHLGELARDPGRQRVDLEQRVDEFPAGVPAIEHVVGQGREDRVLAAVAHPERLKRDTPALGVGAGAAQLLFVRFFQVIKALSRTCSVVRAGRRTEGPGAPHGGARALQVGRAVRLQVARRQPRVDDFERRGGG